MNLRNAGFMAGGGEMGERVRAGDWSNTSVGPLDAWPQSLRTTLGIILNSKFPMFLFWGPELLCFYNDAFRPSLGNSGKHPDALSKPGEEVWPEIWHIIKPLIDQVLSGGEATWHEDQLLPIYRNGKLEDVYWTFSHSPVYDESGNVGGVLVTCKETTEKVVQQKYQKDYLKSAIGIADLGTFRVDVATNIGSYSEKIRDWFEFDTLSQPMEVISSRVHPDDRQMVMQSLDDSLISEEHSRHDFNYRLISARDESIRHLRSMGKVLFTADGTPHSIIGIIQDVSSQITAHQKLEESESRFRNLVEQAPVAIALTRGKDHFFESLNAPMLRLIGRNREETVGKILKEVMPELKDEPVLKMLNTVLETGEAYIGNEVPITYRPGEKLEQYYFNLSYTPLMEDGEVTGVIHVAVDVTEQVVARKKIEEGQEELKRFKFMADQARDPFILMREDGSFAYLNNKAIEAWGYTEEEIKHLRVPDVDPVYQEEAFLQLFAKAQKETIPQFETLHKRKDGHVYPVEVNVVALTIGEKPYLFAVARDITKRKHAEEEIKEKNAQLIRINNDLDNFIYTASHDLKAPISNIEALLHALLRTLPPESLAKEQPRRITSLMQESVERFKKTIANLTEVVKLQKENSEQAVMVDLSEVIMDVRLDLEQMIQSSCAQVEVDVSDCPTIHFSEKNLRSVVYNLLSNAIKYRAPERVPRVQITCKITSDHQVLTVKDNGLGMDPRRTDQLFTMFKRLHSHVEGTGIGLYMVKKMVENADGRIEVESQLGEGTTFHVYFKR